MDVTRLDLWLRTPEHPRGSCGPIQPCRRRFRDGADRDVSGMSKTTARLTTAVNAELAIKTWESESAEQRSLDGEALAHICLGIARAPA